MSEELKEIPLKERIEKLLESGWVNEFNYLESQLQEARSLVVILQQKVEQQEKKIDRLNNIINELEKWCNECIDYHIIARKNGDTTISDTFFGLVLDKLKALKEE